MPFQRSITKAIPTHVGTPTRETRDSSRHRFAKSSYLNAGVCMISKCAWSPSKVSFPLGVNDMKSLTKTETCMPNPLYGPLHRRAIRSQPPWVFCHTPDRFLRFVRKETFLARYKPKHMDISISLSDSTSQVYGQAPARMLVAHWIPSIHITFKTPSQQVICTHDICCDDHAFEKTILKLRQPSFQETTDSTPT